MKTAVSIPDKMYKAAERAAKRMGISRPFFRDRYRATAGQSTISRGEGILDEVYKTEDSRLDPALMAMQVSSLPPDKCW